MELETLIEKLKSYNWSPEQVQLAIRAKCRCEYCGKNMLESVDNYKLWQVDHIIPRSSRYEDCDNINNKAITCTQCNKDLKSRWNPASQLGYGKSRDEYIKATKDYITNKRLEKETELEKIRELYNTYFFEKEKHYE